MTKVKKLKPEKKLKGQKKQQLNQTVEFEDTECVNDDPQIEESIEKITSIFTPIERKVQNVLIQKCWFKDLSNKTLNAFKESLELAYFEQKTKWESEDRISKLRKEYLQSLYDRLEDIKITILENKNKIKK